MYCPKCGQQLNDGVRFCGKCGAEIPSQVPKPGTDKSSSGTQPGSGLFSKASGNLGVSADFLSQNKLTLLVLAVLVVVTLFMPWTKVDWFFSSRNFSIFSFMQLLNSSSDFGVNLLEEAFEEGMTTYEVLAVLFAVAGWAIIIVEGIFVFMAISGSKNTKKYGMAVSVTAVAVSVLFITLILLLNIYVAQEAEEGFNQVVIFKIGPFLCCLFAAIQLHLLRKWDGHTTVSHSV